MARPRRRHYFSLAERLGLPVSEMLERIDSAELSEWLAFDALKDEEYRKRIDGELERGRSKSLTPAEQAEQFKRLLRGR